MRDRLDDLPMWIRPAIVIAKTFGISTIAAVGFWYLCDVQLKKQSEALENLQVVVQQGFSDVKLSLDQQNKALRHRQRDE